MAPVAARLSLGLSPDELGRPLGAAGDAALAGGRASGKSHRRRSDRSRFVRQSHHEHHARRCSPACRRDESVTITCDEHETQGIFTTYSDQPPMTLIALVGSSGRLELAIVDENASAMLGVTVGAPVVVTW